MIPMILKLLGLGNGASVLNKVAGVGNYMLLGSILAWVKIDPNGAVNFTFTRMDILLIGGVGWLVLEVLRRSNPGTHD